MEYFPHISLPRKQICMENVHCRASTFAWVWGCCYHCRANSGILCSLKCPDPAAPGTWTHFLGFFSLLCSHFGLALWILMGKLVLLSKKMVLSLQWPCECRSKIPTRLNLSCELQWWERRGNRGVGEESSIGLGVEGNERIWKAVDLCWDLCQPPAWLSFGKNLDLYPCAYSWCISRQATTAPVCSPGLKNLWSAWLMRLHKSFDPCSESWITPLHLSLPATRLL